MEMNYDPLMCPECGDVMILMKSQFKKERWFYGCAKWPNCRGSIGTHSDLKPVGIPAKKETREWRKRAHQVFDRLWKEGKMSRGSAYRWISIKLGKDIHMGSADVETCKEVISVCFEKEREWKRKDKKKKETR